MNWFLRSVIASGDVSANIRTLVDTIRMEMNRFKHDRVVSSYFADHTMQSAFVSCDAAIQKVVDLITKYRDTASAAERLKAFSTTFSTLVQDLDRRSGGRVRQNPNVARIVTEYRQLKTLLAAPAPQPASQPPAQPSPAPASPKPSPAPQPAVPPSYPLRQPFAPMPTRPAA